MRMSKFRKTLPFVCAFGFVSLCVTPFANASAQPLPSNLDTLSEEILSIDSAIAMVADRVDEEALSVLNDATNAYLLEDGKVMFEFHKIIASSHSTDSEESNEYIPIADNINLYSNTSIDGYQLQWSKPSDLDHVRATGYGVVNGYQCDTNSALWILEMKSNIRAKNYRDCVTKFGWSISYDNANTAISDWSPSGTEISTRENYPINISLKISDNLTISSTFPLLRISTKVTSGVSNRVYSTVLTHNVGIPYPDYQELDALVSYNTVGTTTWSWSWDINASMSA